MPTRQIWQPNEEPNEVHDFLSKLGEMNSLGFLQIR
jgi:hypothetical protein